MYGWRLCNVHDFGEGLGKENFGYFDTWNGFDLFCPDIPENDGLYL